MQMVDINYVFELDWADKETPIVFLAPSLWYLMATHTKFRN